MIISDHFFDVVYNSKRIPGVENQSDLTLGANCQVFSYELLSANGLSVPYYRSSELWSDQEFSKVVSIFEPLDLMLYSSNGESFGAHVAVYIGNGNVIHLSLENGKPEIISHNNMLQNQKYCKFVGAKRILKNYTVS